MNILWKNVLFMSFLIWLLFSFGRNHFDNDIAYKKIIGCYKGGRGAIELDKDSIAVQFHNEPKVSRPVKYGKNRHYYAESDIFVAYDNRKNAVIVKKVNYKSLILIEGFHETFIALPPIYRTGEVKTEKLKMTKSNYSGRCQAE